ncbi:MAG: hypothetical protein EXR72_19780 [Myxococcales bacterium]|nr:hypothetical protein [Myxococcales bacterium]
MLGARVPIDIRPQLGLVHPDKRGMSATPDDPARLPLHFRPLSLGRNGRVPVFKIALADLGRNLR